MSYLLMACSSCAKKAALRNARFKTNTCTYSLAQLNEKLSLAITSSNSAQILILQNAINEYSTNCNKYSSQIQ